MFERLERMEPQLDKLLIYDFDGVVADSEVLANTVLAEIVSELGVPTTLQDAYTRYMGKRFSEVIAEIENVVGGSVPEDFSDDFQSRTLDRFRQDLKLVDGAKTYIDTFSYLPKCIASSSSVDRLALCLDVLGMQTTFEPHVYSASMVPRGKPHPDIFLFAAEQMAVAPSRSIVIEDSAYGVQAGLAAGMTVIGLLAGSHIQEGHRDRLSAAGAHHVVDTFAQAKVVTEDILKSLD